MLFIIISLRTEFVRPKSWLFTLFLEGIETELTVGKIVSILTNSAMNSWFDEEKTTVPDPVDSMVKASFFKKVS